MKNRAKQRRSQLRKNANKTIIIALNRLGIKYVNMNVDQATKIVAEAYGIPEKSRDRIAVSDYVKSLSKKNLPKPNQQTSNIFELPITVEKKKKPVGETAIKEFYDSWEWKRLSYDVKLKRGRKCECCGAKAPDVRIITDHIKPLRKYWNLRLVEANLQVLCDDCNMGKGSRDETDFRPETVIWGDTWGDTSCR